jgi:hypothetical protein
MASRSALALIVVIAISCTPAASSPTPIVSPSRIATPTARASPSPTPTTVPRLQVSDGPFPQVAGAFVLFQVQGETRLRAISFGAEVNGVLGGQVAADAAWSQSPYGIPYLVAATAYDRDGRVLGSIPWSGKESKTWSSEGRFLCGAVPSSPTTGAPMRLEMAFISQPAKVVASGFMTYSDNATYRVLACDEGTDRAVVASFGQGVAPGRLVVLRLSTGAVLRSIDYAGAIGWVAASADATLLAESIRESTSGKWTATVRSTDDGAQMGTIDDFAVLGFSGDKTLVVGTAGGTALAPDGRAAVTDWKTGRRVWSPSGFFPLRGFLPEPAGRRLAVATGFPGGSDVSDVYLVNPDGSAVLLPARVRVALLY